MNYKTVIAFVAFGGLMAMLGSGNLACGTSVTGGGAGGGGGTAGGSAGGTAGGSVGGGTAGGTAGAGGGTACTTVTVKNYLSWCSVTVGSGTASSAASQTTCVQPGVLAVSASPNAGFQLGTAPWHGTDGDTGSGDPGSRSGTSAGATATVGSTAICVWACCEFTGGGGCPTASQCP